MPEQRILVIESPAYLRIDTGRLKVERDGFDHVFVSPSDVAVLCLEHHTATLSVAVLRALAEAGAVVLVTDARHLPCAMMQALGATGLDAGRLRQQMALDNSGQQTELWRQLVAAKLINQAAVLRMLERKGALRLERLAAQVRPGDAGNAEGQGARHYWSHLLSPSFRRGKQGADDPVNIRLNYGYAVLRAIIARALTAAGLNGALGLGHHNAANAFNLADDFIEPYRFLVDVHLAREISAWSEPQKFDSTAKRTLLGFITQPVRMAGQDMRLHAAVDASVASYVRILESKNTQLLLPEGLATAEDEVWVSTDGA